MPLLIGPRSAAAPIGLLQAPVGWFFEAGTYRFTLVADRVVAADALRAMFVITVSSDDLTVLGATNTERFLTYPIR